MVGTIGNNNLIIYKQPNSIFINFNNFYFHSHYQMDTSQPTPQQLIPLSNKCPINSELTSHQLSFPLQQIIQQQCRICLHSEEPSNPLITPCQCIGFLQYVHVQCLQKWLQKKYQQSDNKAQFEQTHSAVCQICHQRYRIDYSFASVWVSCSNFKEKVRINKCAAFANILFIVANLVCLTLGIVLSIKQGRDNNEFDIKSPKVYMMYFLILLTLCTSIYGIYQFACIFMLQKIIRIERTSNNLQQKAHSIKVKG